jgi:protein N-terminal amidase
MRVAIVQTAPLLGQPEKNLARATDLLSRLPHTQLDLIVLPELAFSGYNFPSPKAITPFIETHDKSPSRTWARDVATRFQCSVVVGLPSQDQGARYNTAVMVNEAGEVVYTYHKHFLYSTDYQWGCQPGSSFTFKDFQFDGQSVRMSIGICMDLNPKEYIAPFNAFEYANFLLQNDVRLVVIPMAWLLPSDEDREMPSLGSVEYWARRLSPLLGDDTVRTVVVCNRTGEEGGAIYAGTSCVLQMGRGHVRVVDRLGREEGILHVDVPL